MADVKNQVALHFVWATYDRLPKITPEIRAVVEECIYTVGDRFRCPVVAVGGIEDHMHVLVHFSTTISIGELAKELKGYSSRVITKRFPDLQFKWQGGYGIFPVAPHMKARVENYITNQEEHHRDRTLIAALEDSGFTPNGTADAHPGGEPETLT